MAQATITHTPHPAAAHVPDLDEVQQAQPVFNSDKSGNTLNTEQTKPVSEVKQTHIQTLRQAPTVDYAALEAKWRMQLESQQSDYQRQLAARDEEMSKLRAQVDEHQRAQAEAEFNRLMQGNLGELEYVTEEAAKELREKVFMPMLNAVMSRTENKVNTVHTEFQQAREAELKERQQSRLSKVNGALYERFPDLNQMMESPAYAEFMSKTIPGTRVTYGSQVQEAYEAGDSEYVISVLNQFKGNQPSLESIAAPMGIQHQGALHPATAQETFSYEDLTAWRHQYQNREISHEEYTRRLAVFNQAQAEGRVQ